jgi:predicted nucleotidyltransferase
VARGEATGLSDVDILIVVENPPVTLREQAQAKTRLEEEAELPDHNPLDLHFTSPQRQRKVAEGSKALY